MRFAAELHLRAVAAWRPHYVAYDTLKLDHVYTAERALAAAHYAESDGTSSPPAAQLVPLSLPVTLTLADNSSQSQKSTSLALARDDSTPAAVRAAASRAFVTSLDSELSKVCNFYAKTELSTFASVDALRLAIRALQSEASLRSQSLSPSMLDALRENLAATGADVANLRSFAEINLLAFSKILKKFDKVARTNLRFDYLATVADSYPFQADTAERLALRCATIKHLEKRLSQIQHAVSIYYDQSALNINTSDRNLILDDNTISQVSPQMDPSDLESAPLLPDILSGGSESSETAGEIAPISNSSVTTATIRRAIITFFIAPSLAFLAYCVTPTPQAPAAAVLTACSLLWATESIPLHATALLAPILLVISGAVLDSERKYSLPRRDAAKIIISKMFTPAIPVLLGGFALAAALSKHGIAAHLARGLMGVAGSRPSLVLLASMLVSCVFSMLISNVAAPVLCYSILQPIFRTLPSHGRAVAKSIIIGVALAANIGGMLSPISSPQNLIAMDYMEPRPSWLQWLAISVPVCALSVSIAWLTILLIYAPDRAIRQLISLPQPSVTAAATAAAAATSSTMTVPQSSKLSCTQIYVLIVTIATLLAWCTGPLVERVAGHSAIVALAPLAALCATGALTRDDLASFQWSVVFLAMGGLSLGATVESSGLLDLLGNALAEPLGDASVTLVSIVLCSVILIISTGVSHTVSALIFLPLAKSLAAAYEPRERFALAMSCAFSCSAGMALSVSGFPNMSAASLTDNVSRLYVTNIDFILSGGPTSLLVLAVILSLGMWIALNVF